MGWTGKGAYDGRLERRGDTPLLLQLFTVPAQERMSPSDATIYWTTDYTFNPQAMRQGVGGRGISSDFLSFQTCRVLTYTDRKKHLLNRSAYIKDNKSDMIDESAWPVTKPATAPTRGPIAPFYFFNIFYFYELYESLRCRSSMSWIKPFCMFYTHTHMQQNGLHLCIHIKSASM